LVRCPVCESTAVTVVLNSKPHASCSCCGARWIQEGSWQHSIRPGQPKLPVSPLDDVIVLPDRRPPVAPTVVGDEEAIAT
jgi:hypothetical protein